MSYICAPEKNSSSSPSEESGFEKKIKSKSKKSENSCDDIIRKKESIEVKIENYRILIRWFRVAPQLKESCIPIQEECYRWPIELQIDIPPQVYFDKIHSKLTLDNTLQIIVPKALVPEKIQLEVEYEEDK